MTDDELYSKASPLLFENNPTQYDLPQGVVYETPTAFVMERMVDDKVDTIKLVDYGQYLCDPRQLDNFLFRKKLTNMVTTVCKFHEVFPKLIHPFRPRINLIVEYGHEQLSYWGNELLPTRITEKPKIKYQVSKKVACFWTLLLVGQEVDKPEVHYDHWIIGNIPNANIDSGQIITEFHPTIPFKDGGLHRYTYLICQQKDRIDFNLHGKNAFNTDKFLSTYNIVPKGISFFYSKHSSLVKGFYDIFESLPPLVKPSPIPTPKKKKKPKKSKYEVEEEEEEEV
eukprot:TRINITY_DN18784_c0_g1_i1.p1 TRINITY_DN18784_c0_g1~~TRINITY_DN18784_c0_g1_i1.p1  ORF type:complete len:299 (-),score=57.36 TRINITY_DN18784_c0_g1_i1:21-869(-)